MALLVARADSANGGMWRPESLTAQESIVFTSVELSVDEEVGVRRTTSRS